MGIIIGIIIMVVGFIVVMAIFSECVKLERELYKTERAQKEAMLRYAISNDISSRNGGCYGR